MQAGEPSSLIAAAGFEVFRLPHGHDTSGDSGRRPVESVWPNDEQLIDARETVGAIEALGGRVDWTVVDHYGLDSVWERELAGRCTGIFAIDDLASRQHACNLLLDQNYYRDMQQRYGGLVPQDCRLFLGPEYVLFRPEFAAAKAALRPRDGRVRTILVTFGSNDPDGETIKALSALRTLELADVATDVVVGGSNPRRHEVRALCRDMPHCRYHEQVDYMARLILKADLCLGAGGATNWERCALGLPTLTIVTAPNQLRTTVDTAAKGALIFLGRSENVQRDDIACAVESVMADPTRMRELSARAMDLVPAVDGASRIARALTDFRAPHRTRLQN
jgi:UDP-2,4-diacetamido-2,4,6-trideoxy-beta-L-altropyranose hydrolase